MATCVLIALAVALFWKFRDESGGGPQGDIRRYLDVNLPLVTAGGLFIAFFFQWFAILNGHVQVVATIGESQSNIASLWAYIDTAYIVITAMIGVRLWRGFGRE